MVAGFGIGDLEIEVVTVVGEADLFEGVDVDGCGHWGSVLCFENRYTLQVNLFKLRTSLFTIQFGSTVSAASDF